jgi:hypothetical protein
MRAVAIQKFIDTTDNHMYCVGDEFPRAGHDVSWDRVQELASANNKSGVAVVKVLEEPRRAKTAVLSNEKAVGDVVVDKPKKTPRKRKKEK